MLSRDDRFQPAGALPEPVFVCLPAVVVACLGPMPEETLRRGAVMAFAAVGLAIVTAQLGMRQAVAAGDGISSRAWRRRGHDADLAADDRTAAAAGRR
jgi:hypothetical protein